MNRLKFAAIVLAAPLLTGCLVFDQVTTVTVRPDGTSQLVVFHSNVRSTEQGGKGVEQVNRYADQFDARTSEDFTRIRNAGGELVDAHWIQREAPYSTVVTARFEATDSLAKYFRIEGDNDELRLSTTISQNGPRRRMSMFVLPPKNFDASGLSPRSLEEARERAANGMSEVRVIVADGQITAARGWTIASDKRSAVLALADIEQLFLASPNQVELFIEWETSRQ